MREYVDGIQGACAWDRMHDHIENMELLGLDMPPIDVDGKRVHIFPGTNREVTLEDVQNEVRKVIGRLMAEVSRIEAEAKNQFPDLTP